MKMSCTLQLMLNANDTNGNKSLYIKDILVNLYCKASPHSFMVNVWQNGTFHIILHPGDQICLALCDLCLKMDGPKATINKYL